MYITCPYCGFSKQNSKVSASAKTIKCPKCHRTFKIPEYHFKPDYFNRIKDFWQEYYKIILLVLSIISIVLFAFLLDPWFNSLGKKNEDYWGFYIALWLIPIILMLAELYKIVVKYSSDNDELIIENSSAEAPALGSYMGTGTTMVGYFRADRNSYVGYCILKILGLPIFPIGCYRYVLDSYKDDSYFPVRSSTTTYKFYGKAKPKILEVFACYCYAYAFIGALSVVALVLLNLVYFAH